MKKLTILFDIFTKQRFNFGSLKKNNATRVLIPLIMKYFAHSLFRLSISLIFFVVCVATGVGHLHLYETLQRGRIRDETTKDRGLHYRHALQRGTRGLPYVRGAFGARPGRMGERSAPECQYEMQRAAAAVGSASAGVCLRQLLSQTQYLPAGVY